MWRLVLGVLVVAAIALTALGTWYAGVYDWHETRPGYEGRVEVQLWPPSIGWGERLAD